MKGLIGLLLVCLVIGFLAPTTYWTFVVLCRTLVVFFIGFLFGFIYRGFKE